ncbi:MAG: sugar transferase, partial [Pseudomonas sp.]|nr:sugar transferase [Pseudomonas sp.]
MLKRLFDFVAAGLGLLVLSPVMLVVALLIRRRL